MRRTGYGWRAVKVSADLTIQKAISANEVRTVKISYDDIRRDDLLIELQRAVDGGAIPGTYERKVLESGYLPVQLHGRTRSEKYDGSKNGLTPGTVVAEIELAFQQGVPPRKIVGYVAERLKVSPGYINKLRRIQIQMEDTG